MSNAVRGDNLLLQILLESRLEEQAQRFEQIAEEQAVQDKKDAAGKFRRQIKDVSSIVNA